jgi:hypothetical protein
MKKIVIILLSVLLSSSINPAFGQEKMLNFQSQYINWSVKIRSDGSTPLLTNTNYYISSSALVRSLPVFKQKDPESPRCIFRPGTDGWNNGYGEFLSELEFTLEVNGRPIQITDPETEGGKNVVMAIYILSGRAIPPNDNDNYFSPNTGLVERDPIVMAFSTAGEYTLRYKVTTMQSQEAEMVNGCDSYTGGQDIESTKGTVYLGTVISKSVYEASKKTNAPLPKAKASSIVCVKGKSKLTVTGVKPICPIGYKKI